MVYCRFFQFWLIFPNRNYKSRSMKYNFNWCWHHTLHLKKKTFPIFENLLKTPGTTTVLSCLKIPLASMRVDRFASYENIVPSFKTSSILSPPPPTPPNWSLHLLEETLLQPVLKSFISVFIHYNEGLRN